MTVVDMIHRVRKPCLAFSYALVSVGYCTCQCRAISSTVRHPTLIFSSIHTYLETYSTALYEDTIGCLSNEGRDDVRIDSNDQGNGINIGKDLRRAAKQILMPCRVSLNITSSGEWRWS